MMAADNNNEGSDLSFEDSQEDEFEVEDVVQRRDEDDDDEEGGGDDWEDCDDDEEDAKKQAKKAKIAKAVAEMEEGDDMDEGDSSVDELPDNQQSAMQVDSQQKPVIWDDKNEPLKEGEELEYDGSAYVMLHRTKVEWPCLSIDYLIRERCTIDGIAPAETWFPKQTNGQLDPNAPNTMTDAARNNVLRHKKDQCPMDVYMVAGSQAEKRADNKIYVMKWGAMQCGS